ncbi:MAG: DUF1684 domain-containing protein [Marinicella sp.]|nr:DUF1684 domain-containing protein [Xanthomonadales bacterium]
MKRQGILLSLMFVVVAAHAESSYEAWKTGRLEGLQRPHGWLSLVGLEWLHVGENSIGAAKNNDVQLSHGPDHLGTFWLSPDKTIRFVPNTSSGIKANDEMISEKIVVHADTSEQQTTVFTVDTFQFYVVERGDKFAFRIKDSEADTRINFKGLEYYPENEKYRIDAKFVPYEPAKIIPTVNVLGILSEEPSPGRLEFTIDGESYSLDALDSTDSYYMIFADKTNGRTTYGPGRFVYTDGKVDENGMVRIDFNKAYNPPCAFTAYSTCTLPPRQNRMPVMVEAGEKKYADSVY